MGISSSTEKSQGNWGLKNIQCVVFKGVLSVDIQKAHGTWKSRKSRKWFLLSRYGRHQNLVMLAYLIGNEAGKWILAVCPQGKNWVNNQPDCPGQSWSLHMCFVLILIKYYYFPRRKPRLHLLRCTGLGLPHNAQSFPHVPIWPMEWRAIKQKENTALFLPSHILNKNKYSNRNSKPKGSNKNTSNLRT